MDENDGNDGGDEDDNDVDADADQEMILVFMARNGDDRLTPLDPVTRLWLGVGLQLRLRLRLCLCNLCPPQVKRHLPILRSRWCLALRTLVASISHHLQSVMEMQAPVLCLC